MLVEGPSRKDPAMTTGRTRQNKLVHFAAAGAAACRHLRRGAGHGRRAHHLTGDLLEVTAPARHRTRIPVAAA